MCTKYFSGCLAAIVLLGSLVLPMKSVEAAEKTVVYDDTSSTTDKGSTWGKGTGFGFAIPSGSQDYKIRFYINSPSNFGDSQFKVNIFTNTNSDADDNNSLYEGTIPAGFVGWVDMPAILKSYSGNPYTSYSWTLRAGTIRNPTTRTVRLQVLHEDVTPPTVPQIRASSGSNINYWSSAPIQITIDNSTDNSGIARYGYRIDGGGEQSYTGPFQMPVGAHTVEAISYDNSGLSSGWSNVTKTYYAPDPPTAPVINGLPSGWTNQDVPFTITPGTDNVAGILSTEYMLFDGTTVFDWTSSTKGTISQEGENTITARSTNMARTTSSREARVYVDKTAPVGTLTAPQDWAKSVTIHAVGTDALSGVQSITLPSGDVVRAKQADYIVTANGTYTFMFTDVAGNSATKSITISNVDTTAPTLPVITSSDSGWSANPVQITIGDSTDDSGIAKYSYRIDDGKEQLYTGSFDAPKGSHQIYAMAYDNTGLNSGWSSPVTTMYDPDPPTTPTLSNLDESKWYKSFALQFVSGTGVSGANGVYYTLAGATTQSRRLYDDKQPQVINKDGITTVKATTSSKAGVDSSAVTGTIHIDNTPPVATLSAPTEWAKSVMIHATGTDVLSGIRSITRPNGEVITGSEDDYRVNANGEYSFTFEDVAGNSISKTITVDHIDNTPPAIKTSDIDSTWTADPQTVSYQFVDKESGLDTNNMYYEWSGTDQTPTTWTQMVDANGTLTQSQPGIWYLHLKASDQLGNVSQQVIGPYRIQSKPQTPVLTVIGTATDKMLLSWSLPTGGINTDGLQYIIHNETTDKTWTVDYPVNQLLDDSLVGGSNYRYTITAMNHVGSSAVSTSVIGVTLPEPPTGASIYAKNKDYSRALVSIAPVPSATAYRITATNWSTQQVDANITVTGNVYQEVTGLKPYTLYDFSIAAINESGEGAAYHTSFLSLPYQINGFKSAQITENSIDLKWNSVTRAVYDWSSVTDDTYYRLRRDNQIIFTGTIPTYTDSSLESGTAYDYDVAAGNSTGWGSKATLSQMWTLPAAPRSLRQTQATTSSFTVELNPPKGATGFQANVDGRIIANLGSILNQYTFVGYQPGTTHLLEIAPYNQSGIGKSTSVIVTTLPVQPTAAAIKITDIQADSVTFDVYEVPGATKYRISINGKDYEVAAGQNTVSGLENGTEYVYSVSAGNAAGYGVAYTSHVLTLPAAPTNYQVTERTSTSVAFKWSAIKGATSYEVLDNAGKLVAKVPTPEYNVSGLLPGSMTSIAVRAINASGSGAASTVAFQTLPGFSDQVDYSKLVKVDSVGMHEATLSWLAVAGADQYRVYDSHQQLIAQTTERNTVIEQLASATSYDGYTVVSVNDAGEGHAMPVPNWIMLPDNTMTISHESTRSSITLHLQHSLTAETLVIASTGKELYRGAVNGYTTFTQDSLSPNSEYTYKVWTENAEGDKSKIYSVKIRTEKERAVQPVQSKVPTTESKLVIDKPITPEQSNEPSNESSNKGDKKKGFIDIDRSFAKASITRLADMGIVQGISDDLYAPQVGTTRAEFMALLTRLTLTPEQIKQAGDEPLSFTDVDDSDWYMPELRAAVLHGITKGFSAAQFAPNQFIDREQAAKMLNNTLHESQPTEDNSVYVDSNSISLWAQEDVNRLTVSGILEGYPDQTFRPQSILSRAESATMIDRMLHDDL